MKVKSGDIIAELTYSTNDNYLHLTLWQKDLCLDRDSKPLGKVVGELKLPYVMSLQAVRVIAVGPDYSEEAEMERPE